MTIVLYMQYMNYGKHCWKQKKKQTPKLRPLPSPPLVSTQHIHLIFYAET
jgi:hypothetical protein